ncbi:MAG: ABC-F family ATP-binding cassette domain-containing protein [Gemmatimonadota bacterium]
MISVTNLGKDFGARTLFAGVTLRLHSGRRYGLVGANGSGKTTFLKILSGDTPPSAGSMTVRRRARVGMLEQDQFRDAERPILDVAMMGHAELWEAFQAKERILAATGAEFDAQGFAAAEEIVQRNDGYALEARAGEILEGLGIRSAVHRQPLRTLSGGFRLRVLLAQALAAAPDILLLDEPTNHLDILSIRWLETFLAAYPGCGVIISHDHRFLDNVCSDMLDVDYETITEYPGTYTDFQNAKTAERGRREGEIAKREGEIAGHQAFVDRFRAKASKARQAQSRLKQIARIEIAPLPVSSRRYPTFRLKQRRPSGKVALKAAGLAKAYGELQVLRDVSLELGRGDRLAVIGPNGIGKSTLLKILVGRIAPDAGSVTWGHEAHPGYVAQDHREQLSEAGQTAESWLWKASPGEGVGFVRGHLGLMLFSGDDALKPVGKLSGGEAARLLFARLAVERPNVLVLDEPTNHLDLEAIEALVTGLKAYDGTILFVSHDRWFVGELADRILEITPTGWRDFAGTYAAYLAQCGDDHLDAEAVRVAARREAKGEAVVARREAAAGRSSAGRSSRPVGSNKAGFAEARQLEAIAEAEAALAALDARFADPATYAGLPRQELRKLEQERQRAADQLEALWAGAAAASGAPPHS